jgi:hypothetical protein
MCTPRISEITDRRWAVEFGGRGKRCLSFGGTTLSKDTHMYIDAYMVRDCVGNLSSEMNCISNGR